MYFPPHLMEHCVYVILCVCVLFFPRLLEHSESHESCKIKATALPHVTLPTLSFLFLWPQTPDFSESKNRLLQTLTAPLCIYKISFLLSLPLRNSLLRRLSPLPVFCFSAPDKACCQTAVSVRIKEGYILFYKIKSLSFS